MSSTDYAALADTIKVEDITYNKINQTILNKLKDNDESFDELFIVDSLLGEDEDDYVPDDGEDLGWLGYFIGQNTKLQLIAFQDITIDNESFYSGLCLNKSIQKVDFRDLNLSDEKMFYMMDTFFKNKQNLIKIRIEACELNEAGARQLSLAIGSCNKSLKQIDIRNNEMEGGQLVDIITAMSMHPQLNHLDLSDNGISMGRNECMALATLQRYTIQLQTLNLTGNNIDDEGLDFLVNALNNGNKLQQLYLSWNRSITIDGWKMLSTILEMPESNLKRLFVSYNNNFGDEGALVFANALTSNSTLESLYLTECGVTAEGWTPFSKLLCNTSSVNNTYLSNHTLENISGRPPFGHNHLLGLNKSYQNKQKVTIIKILRNHSHFDMQAFFEWEFKVLPIMIEWFTKAAASTTPYSYEEKIERMKLSSVCDFIKEFPMLYIEPITRKEIADCTSLEEELQGDELEKIQQRKARALRRL